MHMIHSSHQITCIAPVFPALVNGSWPLLGSSAPSKSKERTSVSLHDNSCQGLEFYDSRLNHLCQGSVSASVLHKSDASGTFCQTPFAGLLLQQGENRMKLATQISERQQHCNNIASKSVEK